MLSEIESDLGNKNVAHGRLLTPYMVEPGWQNGVPETHQDTVTDIESWFNFRGLQIWKPVAIRIPTPEDPVFSVMIFNENPSGYFERSGFLWKDRSYFIDLPSAIPHKFGQANTTWIVDNHNHLIQATLLPPETVGHYPSETEMPNQQVSRIGVDRITLGLFEYYKTDRKPAGVYDEQRLRVNIHLFDALERVTRSISNLGLRQRHVEETIESVCNLSEEDVRKLTAADSEINNLLQSQRTLQAQYTKTPTIY